jgi:putative intracellular protease/amidase
LPNLSQRYIAALAQLSQFICVQGDKSTLTHVLSGVRVAPYTEVDDAYDPSLLRLTFGSAGDAIDYVREAFRHAKPLGALGDGAALLAAAGVAAPGSKVPGVSLASQPADLAQGFIADMTMHRHWDRAVKSALSV